MRWKAPAIAAAVTLVVLVAATWPVAVHPSTWSVGASGNDLHPVSWSLHHAAWSLAHLQLPLGHTDRILYPEGAPLVVAAWPQGILLAPLTWTLGAVASFNALQVLNLVLSAALGAWCARRMGAGPPGAALVALATAASPALLATTFNQNPDVTSAWGVPLAAGLAWQASGKRAALAGLAVGVVAWLSPYFGFMAGLAALAMLPWRRSAWLGFAAGVAGPALLLVAVVSPTLAHGGATHKPPGFLSTPLVRLVDPRPMVQSQPQWAGGQVADGAYLGLSLLILALAGRGRGGVRPRRWGLLAGCTVILALGSELLLAPGLSTGLPLPDTLLEHLPAVGQLRIACRFTSLAVFALALGAAGALHTWLPSRRWQWVAVGVVALDLLVLARGLRMVRAAPVPLAESCEAVSMADGPVAVLPRDPRDAALYLATCHDQPVGEGLKGSASREVRSATHRRPAEVPAALRNVGVQWLVVLETGAPELEEIPPSCERAHTPDLRLFRLSDCPTD